MAKIVQQHRYYGRTINKDGTYQEHKDNTSNATFSALTKGHAFSQYGKILAFSIQTVPGVQFYINGNSIWIGSTGIYEIDYSDNCDIKSLKFNENTLDTLINQEQNYLIIDVLYEKGEG